VFVDDPLSPTPTELHAFATSLETAMDVAMTGVSGIMQIKA
jgi:hypothetical protein